MIVNKAYTKPRPTIHRYKGAQGKPNKPTKENAQKTTHETAITTTHETASNTTYDVTDSFADMPVCLLDITKAIILFFKSHNGVTDNNVLNDNKVREAFKRAATTIKLLEKIQSNDNPSITEDGENVTIIKDDYRLAELSDEIQHLKLLLLDKDTEIKNLEAEKLRLESSLIQWPENFQPLHKQQNETKHHEVQRKSVTITSSSRRHDEILLRENGDCIRYAPEELAEMFADLYDNEWRKTYENIVKNTKEDRIATDRLLNIFKECYKSCWSLSRKYLEKINRLLQISPNVFRDEDSEETDRNDYIYNTSPAEVKMIKDIRNMIGQLIVNKLILTFKQERSSYYQGLEGEHMDQYVSKCMQLCWLTSAHDTPLSFKTEFSQGSKFDRSMAIPYSKKGEKIQYVVWPALICQDGRVLARAIVQTI